MKNMKEKISLLLSMLLAFSMTACNTSPETSSNSSSSEKPSAEESTESESTGGEENQEPEEIEVSFLNDRSYKNGFGVMGMTTDTGRNNLGYFTYGGTVDAAKNSVWQLAQWAGLSDLAKNYVETKQADGTYDYKAGGKYVGVNPDTGVLTLGIDATKEYTHTRQPNENWVHNLIEQHFNTSMNINDCEHIYAKMKFTIDFCDNETPLSEFNPDVHNAQLLWYITVTNRPEQTFYDTATQTWSQGRNGDFIWFGVPLWHANGLKVDEGCSYDKGTGQFIYGMDNSWYLNVPIEIGDTQEFKVDILPYMRSALENCQSQGGMKNCNYSNLYLNYMNFGWEVPGTFNCQATIDYFDITYVEKE